MAGPAVPEELVRDLAFFDKQKAQWLAEHEGKFALIHGSVLIGMFDSPENAYQEAAQRFGNVPVLIKQVTSSEPTVSLPALSLGLIDARP
jgi:hypothetical protein